MFVVLSQRGEIMCLGSPVKKKILGSLLLAMTLSLHWRFNFYLDLSIECYYKTYHVHDPCRPSWLQTGSDEYSKRAIRPPWPGKIWEVV